MPGFGCKGPLWYVLPKNGNLGERRDQQFIHFFVACWEWSESYSELYQIPKIEKIKCLKGF